MEQKGFRPSQIASPPKKSSRRPVEMPCDAKRQARIDRLAAQFAQQERSWVVDTPIDDKGNCRVRLSFDNGRALLALLADGNEIKLNSEQALNLSDVLREQAFQLRRLEA